MALRYRRTRRRAATDLSQAAGWLCRR